MASILSNGGLLRRVLPIQRAILQHPQNLFSQTWRTRCSTLGTLLEWDFADVRRAITCHGGREASRQIDHALSLV